MTFILSKQKSSNNRKLWKIEKYEQKMKNGIKNI